MTSPRDAREEAVTPAVYLRSIKACIARGQRRDAYEMLQHAVIESPDDPMILSYFGYLDALVGGKYRNGIEKCEKALAMYKKYTLHGGEDVNENLYPVLYLNLGRTYLAAGKKKEAADSYRKGLQYERRNRDLMKELQDMGIRKRPPLAFLDRSNMVNVFIGRILHKAAGELNA